MHSALWLAHTAFWHAWLQKKARLHREHAFVRWVAPHARHALPSDDICLRLSDVVFHILFIHVCACLARERI
jgi:hypothetical protein